MTQIKWVLGSGSPRRKELLAGIGLEFEIRTKDTPEIFPENLLPQEVPAFLAELKAKALIGELDQNEIVICADTVVILEQKIIGKPIDRADAIAMLTQLSGRTHEVVTGVFMGNSNHQLIESESTLVTFLPLSSEQINYYIDHYQPFDKAGSYGVQEWLGYVAVEKMVGSYTNVMGLPTHKVYQMIQEMKTIFEK